MITSTLVQTEKTVNVNLDGTNFTVTATFTEGSFDTYFDILDHLGDIVDEDSPKGILIANHLIEKYA